MPPTGTVTFLFTDIESSTHLWDAHPEAMRRALARHERIVRQEAARFQGYPYKMIGDGFQIAFSLAQDAVRAAVAMQRALAAEAWGDTPVHVRMALLTGVTEERGDDYVGPALNRLGRLLNTGYGGQILLAQSTADLVMDDLPEGLVLVDLGVQYLRDLARPEHIYQVSAPGLVTGFPPLKTASMPRTNLPQQLTSFIGREKQLDDLRHLLTRRDTRLVTLTGPGGTGKTRLSLQIAAGMVDAFADGVWLVELAPVTDPELLPKLVASVLNIREMTEKPLMAALVDYLRSKKLILILDNCEHMVEACAALADALLRECPGLLILVSSREILGIGGEIPYRVPSLSTPGARSTPSAEQMGEYEAVQLFIERAQTTSPGFTLTEANAADIAKIVRRLDGIPLAIELAAARLRMLTPAQIAGRLDDAFLLLTGGSRAVLPRHQTLRALIDWSYNLLSASESILLRRLAVFSGGWVLESAEAVCPDPPECGLEKSLARHDILPLLGQLVDKSLVFSYQDGCPETSYRMMDTIRQYAHEKMVDEAEFACMRGRHMAYFCQLAESSEPYLRGPAQVTWMDRLEFSLDDLRAALEWALKYDVEAGLRIASALHWFWHIRGMADEAVRWLREGLAETSAPVAPRVRARALCVLGSLLCEHEHSDQSFSVLQESLEIYQSLEVPDQSGIASVYRWLGSSSRYQHDRARATEHIQIALRYYEELGDRFGQSECFMVMSHSETDLAVQKSLLLRSLALKREIGDLDGVAFILQSLSQLAFAEGDYANASQWLDESLERFREVGNRSYTATDLQNKSTIYWSQGDYDLALNWIDEAIAVSCDSGDDHNLAMNRLRKGEIFLSKGWLEQAGETFTEVIDLAEQSGDVFAGNFAHLLLGEAEWLAGHGAQTEEHWQQVRAYAEQHHIHPLLSRECLLRGKKALSDGDFEQAGLLLRQSLSIFGEMNDRVNTAHPLEALASCALRQGQPEEAARLFGAAAHYFRLVKNTLSQPELAWRERDMAELRAQLDEEAFQEGWQSGENGAARIVQGLAG